MAILSQYLKAAAVSAMTVAVLGTALGSSAMATNNYNQAIYRDGNFNTLAQKLRHDLTKSGYQVMDIEVDNRKSNPSLLVFAKKNNLPYELHYTYPGLKLISSSQKQWSTVWQDKKQLHQGSYHHANYNKQKHHNEDIEDNIKKESRYPAIKQQAIRKVTSMGYQVKKIEVDEKNNRGVFEIEAKKGAQDYDIILGYPNLNVIKVEKD